MRQTKPIRMFLRATGLYPESTLPPTGSPLILARETGFQFDPNAIVVLNGRERLGMIPGEEARILAPIMDAGAANLRAEFVGRSGLLAIDVIVESIV